MRTLPILLLAATVLAGCSSESDDQPVKPYQKQALDNAKAAEQQILDAQKRQMGQLPEQK